MEKKLKSDQDIVEYVELLERGIKRKDLAINLLEEENKKLKKENEDLIERLSAMTQLYMNLLKYKK